MAWPTSDAARAENAASCRSGHRQHGRWTDTFACVDGHPSAADIKALWLGARTRKPLGTHGLRTTVLERAELAGIKGFHPHMLRHTAASRWLSKGGTEGGLMSVAGWSDRTMLDRYARATASEPAAAEARLLNLGDL